MKPLVSFLIPSLGRFDKLLLAVKSIYATADNPWRIEIIVRLHVTDEKSYTRITELPGIDQNLRIVTAGDKPEGAGNQFLWNQLSLSATGEWLQFFSDDMILQGKGWDTMLAAVEEKECVIHPEHHQLNESVYHENEDGPVPFIHASAFGSREMTEVPDLFIYREFVQKRNWPVYYLRGITVVHNREEDATTALANA